MRKVKSVSSLLIALTLTATVVGCSSTTDNSNKVNQGNKTTSNNTKTDGNTTKPDNTAAPAEPVYDLKGQSIKIGVWYDDADPRLVKEKGPAEEAQIKLIEAAEKKYNCKIEYVKFGDYGKYVENFTTTSLSGTPFADIVLLELFWAFPQLVNKEFIQPVDDYLDLKDPKYINWMKVGGSYKGKQYGMTDSSPSPYGMFYNKTLVQKMGLEDPYTLQQKGEWTWEKFREFAKSATKDTNSDGKTDVFGVAGAYGKVKSLTEQFVYTNKGSLDKDANGDMNFSMNSENSIEALQYVSDLYNTDKSIMQPVPDDASKEFIAGKGVIYAGFSWELGGLVDNMKDQQLGYVFFPKGPKADKYVSYTPFGNMYMVSKYSKNAEVATRVLDEISLHDEGRKLSQQAWETSYPSKESLDTRKQMSNSIEYISYYGIQDGEKMFESVVKDITVGKVSPATAVDKVKPQFEANMNKLLADSK
ncbi:ABC transporter substrate-binding protein [Paenibacillus baekrokdamisoli]|uniref:ABC transporter substrate-binding protein n=1 Tax=Paenibacillus baekrokdamisoli TaxID=1712516 RepID=A0A3G9IQJ0_9BACL|nr:extracellular solute-binding protein [Paenibacillus baekrokdamisoli]MBB3070005.1 ABC-type glycerol-3-phosphate transport system substrate-binding protein [Paenibacillus baekrokdamisoli]BBH20646.1 ABC transporter substrate-binding protein [Paenibacillus baekrokdamisoli]